MIKGAFFCNADEKVWNTKHTRYAVQVLMAAESNAVFVPHSFLIIATVEMQGT